MLVLSATPHHTLGPGRCLGHRHLFMHLLPYARPAPAARRWCTSSSRSTTSTPTTTSRCCARKSADWMVALAGCERLPDVQAPLQPRLGRYPCSTHAPFLRPAARRHHFKKEEGVTAIEETIDAHLVEASKVPGCCCLVASGAGSSWAWGWRLFAVSLCCKALLLAGSPGLPAPAPAPGAPSSHS